MVKKTMPKQTLVGTLTPVGKLTGILTKRRMWKDALGMVALTNPDTNELNAVVLNEEESDDLTKLHFNGIIYSD